LPAEEGAVAGGPAGFGDVPAAAAPDQTRVAIASAAQAKRADRRRDLTTLEIADLRHLRVRALQTACKKMRSLAELVWSLRPSYTRRTRG
jgi:hypothetical protein